MADQSESETISKTTPPEQSPLINGNTLSGSDYKVELKERESPEELTARLKREGIEAKVKLIKDVILSIATVGFTLIVGIACLVIVLSKAYDDKTKDSAMSLILLIVGGFLGYITGKASKEK